MSSNSCRFVTMRNTKWLSSAFLFILLLQLDFCLGDIENLLSYHEVIHASKTHLRDRRSADGETRIDSREFHFTAFNMTLRCHLRPRTDLLSKDFKLKVFGREGEPPKEVELDRDRVFVGKCDGDPKSEIRGVFKDGIFSGTVSYEGQVYGIEDAKAHLPPETRDVGEVEERMIVYRTSDIKWADGGRPDGQEPSFCGNSYYNPNHVIDYKGEKIVVDKVNTVHSGARYKRATQPSWNTCKIIVVADYKFYQEMGSNSVTSTALYMMEVIDQVDQIYRTTDFSSFGGITGLGFEIGEMNIYQFPTRGFNSATGTWDALALLQSFSATSVYQEYCAAHLFTHQSFEGNVLGLAYIAPDSSSGVGGICSPAARLNNVLSSLNTGWSTTRNGGGDTVLVQQANLVTAHEFGHNWGSEHDPESGGCAPSSAFGNGKYLMYPYSVSGYDSNNNKFSTCSRETISRVLNVKGPNCFTAKEYDESTLCGNSRIDVENNEQCDAGLLGRFNLDTCCTSFCTFVEAATCSPLNYECCVNCQTAGPGTVCRQSNDVDCLQTAVCNGRDLTCPPSAFKNDTTKCLDEGECRSGVCLPFCEAKGLNSCACDQLEESCYRCCRASEGAICRPYDSVSLLPDGRPCVGGSCVSGVCEKTTSTTIQRLFNVLENLTVDKVVKFFKDNIVGTVMVFSLVLWIPLCLLISYKDRHKRKGLERSENIESRMNRVLLYDEDKRQVVIPEQPAPYRHEGATSPRYRNVNFTDLGGFGSDA